MDANLVFDFLSFLINGAIAGSSLWCLGILVSRPRSLIATKLAYAIVPIGSLMSMAGAFDHAVSVRYAGDLITDAGICLLTFRIIAYLSRENGNDVKG